jgi:hypothetical protein
MAGKTEKPGGSCEFCAHYEYDDKMDCYVCEMNLDEDEMVLFLQHQYTACPYFSFSDDYKLAGRQ